MDVFYNQKLRTYFWIGPKKAQTAEKYSMDRHETQPTLAHSLAEVNATHSTTKKRDPQPRILTKAGQK